MNSDLNELLYRETAVEKAQKNSHQFTMDIPKTSLDETRNTLRLTDNYFFANKEIFISKHNRFAPYPLHSHQFLELNYVYSGSCQQTIDGVPTTLQTGDVVLLDVGSKHSIDYLGENDILINILFRTKDIHIDLLNKLKNPQSALFNFLLNISTGDFNHIRSLIFRNTGKTGVATVIETIMNEYFFPREYSDEIISSYLPILFLTLTRDYKNTLIDAGMDQYSEPVIFQVLNEIDHHYDTVTLDSVAKKLSYNKNYLSNLIKAKTGNTFTELLNKQRLNRAHLLITSTKIPISRIITEVGFSNKNYFYKKYKESYQHLPTIDR